MLKKILSITLMVGIIGYNININTFVGNDSKLIIDHASINQLVSNYQV